ncbi:MAG: DinB family protein, partial [Bacteroidetes bacterium]|nr:DinB family protein [Bacteroidota bacterium]
MNTNQLIIKMVFDRWNGAIKNCDTLLNNLTDEQILKEVAQNKNRGIYIIWHLIAVH